MSVEVLGLRSSAVSHGEVGSPDCYSSSEASSRFAARLERSEYKRSRGKQRLQNQYGSGKAQRRRDRDNGSVRKNSRRKNNAHSTPATSAPATSAKEGRNYSGEEAVTSIWEVHGQQPPCNTLHYSDESFTATNQYKDQTTHGRGTRDRESTRPRSIHDISLESAEGRSPATGRGTLKEQDMWDDSQQTEHQRGDFRTLHHKPDSYQALRNTKDHVKDSDKHRIGSYLSRSLSSSFSSHVGSSDEKENYQGIYSAYDMAGRSPYGSSLSRRYSQSSLSSSSASWHQSTSMKELPSLLENSPQQKPRPKSMGFEDRQWMHHENFKITDFNKIRKTPPAIPPKPVRFSSSCIIRLSTGPPGSDGLHERSGSNSPQSPRDYAYPRNSNRVVPVLDFSKTVPLLQQSGRAPEGSRNDGPKVREIARRFTANVTHISSECHSRMHSEEDGRRITTENRPKVAAVAPQEREAAKEVPKGREAAPSRLPHYRESSPYGPVLMRHRDDTHKEDLSSHRLSLQELIKLHEDQIALHTKSALAAAQVHVNLRRSASDVGRQRPEVIYAVDQQYAKDDSTRGRFESSPISAIDYPSETGLTGRGTGFTGRETGFTGNVTGFDDGAQRGYEVHEVLSPKNAPFKVIEITDKTPLSPGGGRDRTPRVKRHRTIGIVGYRQQIDRTHETEAVPKQKRHTISMVSLEAVGGKQEGSSGQVRGQEEEERAREDEVVKADLVKEEKVVNVEATKDDDRYVKIINIDSSSVMEDDLDEGRYSDGEGHVSGDIEKPVVAGEGEEYYSSEPRMELLNEMNRDEPVRPPSPPNYQPSPPNYQPSPPNFQPSRPFASDYQTQATATSSYQPQAQQATISSYQHQTHTQQETLSSYQHSTQQGTISSYQQQENISSYQQLATPQATIDSYHHQTHTQQETLSSYQQAIQQGTISSYQQQDSISSHQHAAQQAAISSYHHETQQAAISSYQQQETTSSYQPIVSSRIRESNKDTRNAVVTSGVDTPSTAPSPVVELDAGKDGLTAHYRAAVATPAVSRPAVFVHSTASRHDVLPTKPFASDFRHDVLPTKPFASDLRHDVLPTKPFASGMGHDVLPTKPFVPDMRHDVLPTRPFASDMHHNVKPFASDMHHDVLPTKPFASDKRLDVLPTKPFASDKPTHAYNELHPIKAVPVAQVSPVHSQQYPSPRNTDNLIKTAPTALTPPEPRSAQEMYETRLAMWNLIPGWEGVSGSKGELPPHPSHIQGPLFSKREHLEEHSRRGYDYTSYYRETSDTRKPLPTRTEQYYLGIIDKLTRENQALKDKSEAEKREFKQMYEEQKKVANAYQKLEDRYRRRVHELQDALTGCSCQGTLMAYQKSFKSSSAKSVDNESERSKALSGKTSLHILDELEVWLSEQSKNAKTTKTNNTSRDSLISSSSDLTGTGWDDHYEMMGAIDQLNGTHV